jgi:hypothetical protein
MEIRPTQAPPASPGPDASDGRERPDSFVAAVGTAFRGAEPGLRARLVERLLPHVRPLALAVLGGGVFARFLTRADWSSVTVGLDELADVGAEQIAAIARYVAQSSPGVIASLCSAFSEDFGAVPALASLFLVLAMRELGNRRQIAESPVPAAPRDPTRA